MTVSETAGMTMALMLWIQITAKKHVASAFHSPLCVLLQLYVLVLSFPPLKTFNPITEWWLSPISLQATRNQRMLFFPQKSLIC